MDNRIIGIILTVAVSSMLIGSFLITIIDDVVDDTREYYNNTAGSFSRLDEGENISMTLVPTGNTSGTIHNLVIPEVSTNGISNGVRCIILGDTFRISQGNSRLISLSYVLDGVPNDLTFEANTTLNISFNNNVVSVSNGTDTYDIPYSWSFYRDSTSTEYKMLDYQNSDRTIYLNNLDQVYSSNWLNTTGEFFSLRGTDVKIYGSINSTSTAEYDGLTEVMNGVISFVSGANNDTRTTGLHFEVINSNGDPYEVYPYWFVVPYEVYGQTETAAAYTAMLYAIPVILFTALIVMVLSSIMRRA